MLEEVKDLLGRAEELVTGIRLRPPGRIAPSIADGLWRVPMFMMAGMEGLWSALLRVLFFGIGWSAILLILTFVFGKGGQTLSVGPLLFLSILLGIGSVVLDTPSGLVSRNVKGAVVAELAAYIDSRASCQVSTRLLKEGVAIAEGSVSRRLIFVTWLLGLMWAFLTWLCVNWVFDLSVPSALKGTSLSWVLAGGLILLMLAVAFSCYREAHRILSQTVAFSFLQVEANRLTAPNTRSSTGVAGD